MQQVRSVKGAELTHLEKTARCISHGVENELPYLISDRGYGILPASSKEVISAACPYTETRFVWKVRSSRIIILL